MKAFDVVVVGAGWAGLSAADRLHKAGLRVVVVEKGRGPGGRSATRRQDGFQFDHGAQYFTARQPEFQSALRIWQAQGLVATWSPRIKVFGERPDRAGQRPNDRWVGVPGMNGVLSKLAGQLDCRFAQRVEQLDFTDRWTLRLDDGQTMTSKSLILTAPPAQAADLLGLDHPFSAELREVPMQPTWALMAGFDGSLDPEFDPGFDAAFDNEGPLSWIALNSSKPGRAGGPAWLAHADVAWSEAHLEKDPEWIKKALFAALCARLGLDGTSSQLAAVHRWRYAQCRTVINKGCLWDEEQNLAVAGDWCAGNRVEGAWTSGQRAALHVEAACHL